MLLDITAPIIPFKGSGEIKLYSTRDELNDLLLLSNGEIMKVDKDWIRYDIQNSVELLFHHKNNKLFRIITMENSFEILNRMAQLPFLKCPKCGSEISAKAIWIEDCERI